MSYKLLIIKKILETDEETDKKILALLQCEAESAEIEEAIISMEDRQHARKPVTLDADINTGKECINGMARDVSKSGAFLCTDEVIAKGEEIAIRLIKPDGEDFEFTSEVVRQEPSGIGILIKNISSFHQDRFYKFVEKL
jgi:hypothetical protein